MFQRKESSCPDLRVGALRMVAITPEMLRAELSDDMKLLGELLHAKMTVEWPPVEWEPHVFRFILKQYDEFPQTVGWHRYVVLTDALGMQRTLVGAVGGFPKPNGDAEIGYSTLPKYQRRGYATACAKTLVEWLLGREGIVSVSASTYPTLPESIKVMERCGMTFMGEGDEVGTVKYQRVKG
jgi:ribosomal-protein-alanine N-acetyltransferase